MTSHTVNPVLEAHSAQVGDPPSVEERRALIRRIAASEQLSRSTRLRDFLLYVGKQSLLEGCPEISEQEIGARVFGRPASYDRSQDNIVRVNATELRKRIESYFATTGAHETLILDIPRGGYKPVFRRRAADAHERPERPAEEALPAAHPQPEPAHGEGRGFFRQYSLPILAALSLCLAIACGGLLWQNRTMRKTLHPWEGEPAVAAFWTDFLHSHKETDIVLPDSSVGLSQEITEHPIELSEYLSHDYIRKIQEADLGADRKTDLSRIFSHNLVTFGDVQAAQRIFALDPGSGSLHLTVPRFYEADSLKRDNVILIGGKKANPWVYLFDDQMNFTLDSEGLGMTVANRHPQTGEQAVYAGSTNPNRMVGYSVVAYLPNPSHTGNAIIFAGTDSDATNAAAEFLTSEDQLERFRNTLHSDRFPYFEVLLKTSHISGTSFNAEIAAYRAYPGNR